MFLMIACVCGAIAAVGASQFMQAQGTGAPAIAMSEVFVATRIINQSEEIKAEMMSLEAWPTDRVPPGATSELAKVEGRFAAQKMYPGEPIINEKLLDEASDIAVAIPKGFSVVSMKADAASSVANLVRPGDRVNVMAYFTKSDLIPETGVRTVLTGVKVFAVDGRTTRSNDSVTDAAANTVSLLIDKEDEEAWTLASELGRIRLSLGRPAENGSAEANETGGQEFLKWLSDYEKADARNNAANALMPANSSNVSNAQPRKKAQGFKVLKMHGGEWTEYEFVDGQQTPKIVGTSGTGGRGTDDAETETEPATEAPGFSYLNGSQSPFYEPNSAAAGKPVPTGPVVIPPAPKGAVSGVDAY